MAKILGEKPDARILVISSSEGDVDIHRALSAGALGYVLKGMQEKPCSRLFAKSTVVKKAISAGSGRGCCGTSHRRSADVTRNRGC